MTTKTETKAKATTKAAAKVFTLIGSVTELNAAIKSIAGRAAKLDADIHRAAVSVIMHSAKHNDPDVAKRLVDAMGKTMRKQALIAWIVNYGAFTLSEANELVYVKERRDQVMAQANIDAAIAEPFWSFAPEKPYVQFDLAKALQALMAKAEKALTAEGQDAALISPEKLAALRAIVAPAEDSAV